MCVCVCADRAAVASDYYFFIFLHRTHARSTEAKEAVKAAANFPSDNKWEMVDVTCFSHVCVVCVRVCVCVCVCVLIVLLWLLTILFHISSLDAGKIH